MSRHRAVKNLDLADELDDGYDSGEDYYADMTSEQQAQMAQAISAVQAVLGTDSPISDKAIRDALWDSYFDVDGTIAFLLDEQHKKEQRKKKEEDPSLAPPSASLASLSLDTSASNPTTLPPPVPTPASAAPAAAAPKSKLAAKMAASRAAKAAAAAPPVSAAPAPSAAPEPAAAPEKKLSKLQQKMLAAKAGRGTPSTASAASSAPAPAAAPVPEPAPPVSDPMAVDEAPASTLFGPSPLLATPSLFASALSPSARPTLEPVAKRLAGSLSVAEAIERGKVAAFGLSPDDKVWEARKGTSLGGGKAAAAAPVRR